ncbi:putative hydrolase of HD superfamily [Caenispirillum salinarum AK4]|uniref:Putative hydrolase of HD superfamily n=1 Tax=Caenispirillum salinarum AK4 TaxID=1238182 RepID=K9GSC0_9PROT|nr:HD family hydrolase [Caenispirillum salinarum]EKV28067.1 putative hydrolase of HD superfamily [Caenispirillum salinarum AK4]
MTDTNRLLQKHAPRTWQRMLSGRRLNLLEPSAVDVEIEDIALGLARNTRWNGQTIGEHAWSIAQHSDLVVDIMRGFSPAPPPWVLMAGKLHDASEYVTHDLITPLKAVVGDVFKEVEARLTEAIHIRFGLPARLDPKIKQQIKKADQIAAATEAVQLAGFTADELKPILGIKARPLAGVTLTPLPSDQARRTFLEGFHALEAEMAAVRRT